MVEVAVAAETLVALHLALLQMELYVLALVGMEKQDLMV
jgi:hypothetical protein